LSSLQETIQETPRTIKAATSPNAAITKVNPYYPLTAPSLPVAQFRLAIWGGATIRYSHPRRYLPRPGAFAL
jgi:hypothetical protein